MEIKLTDREIKVLESLERRLTANYNDGVKFVQHEEDRLIIGNILDMANKHIEYSIIAYDGDDEETRIGKVFDDKKSAMAYAKKHITKKRYNGYHIMEMTYHFHNSIKEYDDEEVVESIDFDK